MDLREAEVLQGGTAFKGQEGLSVSQGQPAGKAPWAAKGRRAKRETRVIQELKGQQANKAEPVAWE